MLVNQNVMKRINYKQVILHFVATCFFTSAAISFSRLYNIELLNSIIENGVETVLKNPEKYGITITDIWNFTFYANISSLIGIFIAFTISIIISLINRWSLLNCCIVLLLSLILNKLLSLDLYFIYPSSFTKNLALNFSISGLLFLTISCFIFFSSFSNSKINSNPKL